MSLQNLAYCKHCLALSGHGGKGIKASDPNRHTSVVLVELQGNSLCLAISSPNGKEIPPKDASVMPVRY